MKLDPNRLAAYLASKICHDLVSPVGAAASALDFMADASAADMREQAEQLLVSSTNRTLNRLQFLRYAFGSMGMSHGGADLHEAKSIVEGYVDTHKGNVIWDIRTTESLSYSQLRVMMNIVMLGLACLSRDGDLEISIYNGNGVEIALRASGRRAKMAPDVRAALTGAEPEDGWDPRTIQPYFTISIIEEVGGKFSFETGEEEVKFLVTGL